MAYRIQTHYGLQTISDDTNKRRACKRARTWLAELERGQKVSVINCATGAPVALYVRSPETGRVRTLSV